jgi:hypothetical protein
MPQVQITPAALPISNPGAQTLYGQNNGNGALYLSTTQDVNPSNYHAIVGPGGSFSWPADEALYACTDVGGTTLLTYLTNGATVDSGSSFSQASNKPVLLASLPLVWDAAVDNFSVSTPALANIDISAYASVIIAISNAVVGGVLVPAQTNYIVFDIGLYDQVARTANLPARQYAPQFLLLNPVAAQQIQSVQFPVTHQFLSVLANVIKAATAGISGALTINIYGSGELISAPKYLSQGNGMQGSGPTGGFYYTNNAGVVNTNDFVASQNGPAVLGADGSIAAATTVTIQAVSKTGFFTFGQLANPIANNYYVQALLLPMLPIRVQNFSTNAGNNSIGTLNQ